ncbi:fanconi anemia group D2 protein isoform X2 [Tasmannia lanceolata]|uniref:fanconi anemia group D2 protein isoform X2 n=1 Tax=Tasmannia lanceolata TaxID=3420 RepID=UPI00406369E3
MVFLHRTSSARKKPSTAPISEPSQPKISHSDNNTREGGNGEEGIQKQQEEINVMTAILADAGCTLCNSGGPPFLPADPHKLRRHLENRFSSDKSLIPIFICGFSSYIQNPQNLPRVLISAPRGDGSSRSDSLVRVLLLVAPIQVQLQHLLLEKLPEYFHKDCAPLIEDDVARLILNHFRWLDFLVDSKGFTDKLLEVLSICPLQLKKEIIGSLPEMVGDQNDESVVSALERMLQEDSEIVAPMLDTFSNLNLDDQLLDQVVTIALSCIRTIDAEHMPILLRFLLLSATPVNVQRIISQIREHLKLACVLDPRAARHKKVKGKSLANNAEASILEALRSSLRFKNILCEVILKELKGIGKPRDHKVIDVWFLMLIYTNGGALQKSVEKIIKKKVIDGCFREALFDQCVRGHRELVQDYFPSFLSICEYLLACKEQPSRDFGVYMYTSLFEEFVDTYSRQEVLGALITHIGSGISYEVNSALETMILLTSKYSQELLPLSSYINGILDYLEGFNDENLHQVYEVFSHLALSARSNADSVGSSIANELLMILRKQVGNPDLKYKKMGIIGTLKLVSSLGDINFDAHLSSSQKTNSEEALELLKMSLDSCKLLPLPLILFYDELIELLEFTTLQPAIMEWMGKHVGEFESMFLSDLVGGQLPAKHTYGGLEGGLWINLDGDLSPICLNIFPLLSSCLQQSSSSLQILPANFLLLSVVERLTNQGSLGGIDALLGCPLHLPSSKYFVGAAWKSVTGKEKQILCLSLYYALNWIRELLNAFCTQVAGRVDCITQATKGETIAKLLKRLRNLVFVESLLNASLKLNPLSLPELHSFMEHSGSSSSSRHNHFRHTEKKAEKRKVPESTSPNNKKKSKKNSTVPESSDLNGKLRQPTILDALKRAGAVISQEMSNEGSSGLSSKGRASQSDEHQAFDSNEPKILEISPVAKVLDAQRFKLRPLLVDCLFILSFSESQDSCCSDPAAELPMHLYLLFDFHHKLDYFSPPSKQFPSLCSTAHKAPSGLGRMSASEFLNKIRPLFPSLKKHLDAAICTLKEGPETCQEHWKIQSSSAGNPDIPCAIASKSSVAGSVIREILCCFSKMLNLPDVCIPSNLPVLTDLLGAFQPIRISDDFRSGIQQFPSPGNIDYLYCGASSFLEDVLDIACSFSFSLASEVLVTLESLVKSTQMFLEKFLEGNGKNIQLGLVQGLLPFLQNRLGTSACKLLGHDWDCENLENGGKNKGDTIQRILQIYLKNNESPLDLLDKLACSILPQVPSCKTKSTQDVVHGFPTLCSAMFVIWYRVLAP